MRLLSVVAGVLCVVVSSGCAKEPAAAPVVKASGPATSRAAQSEYVVELLSPEPAAAGEKRQATVRVTAGEGFKVNEAYPLAFTPDEVEGLRFEGRKLPLSAARQTPCADGKKDEATGAPAHCALEAPVDFVADHDATLSGQLAFSVCQADRCLVKKVRLAAAVPVR